MDSLIQRELLAVLNMGSPDVWLHISDIAELLNHHFSRPGQPATGIEAVEQELIRMFVNGCVENYKVSGNDELQLSFSGYWKATTPQVAP
jgi:hypothetical protein